MISKISKLERRGWRKNTAEYVYERFILGLRLYVWHDGRVWVGAIQIGDRLKSGTTIRGGDDPAQVAERVEAKARELFEQAVAKLTS